MPCIILRNIYYTRKRCSTQIKMLESSKQIKKNNILYNKVDLSLSSCVHVSMEKGTFCATYRRIRPLAIFGVTRLPIFFFVLRCKYMYRIEL